MKFLRIIKEYWAKIRKEIKNHEACLKSFNSYKKMNRALTKNHNLTFIAEPEPIADKIRLAVRKVKDGLYAISAEIDKADLLEKVRYQMVLSVKDLKKKMSFFKKGRPHGKCECSFLNTF